MSKLKYIPTDYSSSQDIVEIPWSINSEVVETSASYPRPNQGVIETPWSMNSEKIEISGYQPRLRNRAVSTQENSSDTTTDSVQDTKQTTYTKPVQETVQAKPVYSPLMISVDAPQKDDSTQKSNLAKSEGKIYTNKQEFVKDMTDAYTKALTVRGINTDYAKMLVAQDAIESNWGKSSLSKAFNFGGVKAVKGSPFVEKETKEYSSKDGMHKIKAKFRKFNSLDEYVNYKIDLLSGKRYQAFTGDPSQFYHRVKAGGYATDPDYVAKLTNMYNSSILSVKQGGNIPSRIDALVEKFNKQFNK